MSWLLGIWEAAKAVASALAEYFKIKPYLDKRADQKRLEELENEYAKAKQSMLDAVDSGDEPAFYRHRNDCRRLSESINRLRARLTNG